MNHHQNMMMNRSIPTEEKRKIFILELPTHIIFDILSRLPVKTLFCCQLVCKEWLSLITSDPHFARLHLSRSPICPLLLPLNSGQLRLLDLGLQTLPNSHARGAQLKLTSNSNFPIGVLHIVNSCNGLLCLFDFWNHVWVCNPILREFITLPLPPLAEYDGWHHRNTGAFGFSPRTNQYKVIQFFVKRVSLDPITGLSIDPEDAEAEIYTLGEGLWRNLGRVPFHPASDSFYASLNGALHWLTFDRGSPDFIRCFDFGSEWFRVVPEPLEFGVNKKGCGDRIRLGVLRDSLSMCDFSSPHRVDIWIMKDYGIKESWIKEFVIENAIVKRGQLDYCEPIMILGCGDILMLVNKNALVQYNPKLGRCKNLNVYGVKSEFSAIGHIPSFVSLADVAKGEKLMV